VDTAAKNPKANRSRLRERHLDVGSLEDVQDNWNRCRCVAMIWERRRGLLQQLDECCSLKPKRTIPRDQDNVIL
jgi:hypothetical protein